LSIYVNNGYKPEYDALVIKMFSEGETLADFCVKVGCGRRTVYEWTSRYPKGFAKSYEYARECAKAYHHKFCKENMEQTYGVEGSNFDVKSYMKLTQQRFIDMGKETAPPKIIPKGKDPDLYKAICNLASATANEEISTDISKALTSILNSAVGIKEREMLAGRLEEIEKLLAAGAAAGGGVVVSPEAECEDVDDTKAK